MANKPTPADFSPTVPDFPVIGQYQPIYGKFDLTTYVQGASDYEIMAFLVQCYNATLKGYSDVTQLSKDTVTAYNQLQTWVNTWFDELDVQQEINNKLQSMYEAGTLANAIEQSNTIPPAVAQYLNSAEGTQNLSNVTAQKIEAMATSGALGTVINNTGTVQSTTTNWLQQNVTPTGSTVMVDKSLSIEGAAADSKATGLKISDAEEDIDNLNSNFIGTINLFDKDSAELLVGKYVAFDGSLHDDARLTTSGFITLKDGVYTTKINTAYYGSAANLIPTYTSTGTFINNLTGVINSDNLTFEISGKTIIRLKLVTATYQTTMLVKGNQYPDHFLPYTKDIHLSDNIYISARNVEGLDVYAYNKNPLYGKKIAVNGDSICYGNGYVGGYAKIIADENNMAMQNIAVGGGTIAAETYMSDGRPRHWICRTIENLDADSDYVIIEGGVNDGEEIGEISNGYRATLVDTTFCGALESICKQLTLKFAGKKYGFIIPHKMSATFVSGADKYDKCLKILEKWGIPYIDLENSCPAFGFFTVNDADLYPLTQKYTTNADGWHPTEECYRLYYVHKIEAWMKTL